MDELHIDPMIEDMVTFLSSIPELSKQAFTSYVFKLCCLCFGHFVPELPNVSLGLPDRISTAIDLADVIEPLKSHLLMCNADQSILVIADSIISWVELLAEFGDKVLQPSNEPRASVVFHGRS